MVGDYPDHNSLSDTSSAYDDEDYFFNDDSWDDCYLTRDERDSFTAPSQQKWKDLHPNDHPAIVTVDSSLEEQWELAKKEIAHVRKQVRAILNINKEDPDAIVGKVIQHFIGRGSKISRFFEENLSLSGSKYLDFMHTFCMQAAYDCSVKQLYHEH